MSEVHDILERHRRICDTQIDLEITRAKIRALCNLDPPDELSRTDIERITDDVLDKEPRP